MKLRLLLVVVFALVAAACNTSSTGSAPVSLPPSSSTSSAPPTSADPAVETPPATAARPPEYAPRFEEASCRFVSPLNRTPRCGYLVVPENRDDPEGNEVRLHVAIFDAEGPAQPDPVVYLEGGPGGYALEGLEFGFEDRFGPFTADREVIVFDQRGVGFSEPDLTCAEEREVEVDLLDEVLTKEEYTERVAEALAACRARVAADSVDVARYTSADNAADVADLRVALGYDEWNLYGISYGTRLALTVMRDHPEGIRSVILDSTVPLQNEMLVTGPPAAQGAFDIFFADCAADPRCNAAYPDLESRYYQLVDTLNETPAAVQVQNFFTRDRHPALLTGNELSSLLFQGLYSEQIIPLLPDMIADAESGDYTVAERVWSAFFTQGDFFSLGMHLSTQCSEEYAFTAVDDAAAAAAAYPALDYIYGNTVGEYDLCEVWGAGTSDEIETQPVASTIPALVLAGEFDPITPPAYGRTVATDLTNSYFYEFRGLAHGVSAAGGCPMQMSLEFVADPTVEPDASCIEALTGPSYAIDGDLEINLVPFTDEFLGVEISGVVPEDWNSQGFGAYVAPGLGDSGIIQQAVPALLAPQDVLLEDLAEQFGVPPQWEQRPYDDGRSWTIYSNSDDTLNYDVAMAEDDGFLYVVALLTVPETRAQFFDEVLLPALAAVKVEQ